MQKKTFENDDLNMDIVWIGENDTKAIVWIEIFGFDFAQMKKTTFENALVWRGPSFNRSWKNTKYRLLAVPAMSLESRGRENG